MTKPLHKQKDKAESADDCFGERALASDAWGWDDGENGDDEPLWRLLQSKLIRFLDSADGINLKTLVNFWNDAEGLKSLGATLPFEYATRLLAMARDATKTLDLQGARVLILASGVVLQSKATDFNQIVSFVESNDVGSDDYVTKLAETLPFCSIAVEATKSPVAMAEYLEKLNDDELRAKAASAAPLIEVIIKDGTEELPPVERTISVNSLFLLNTVLQTHCGVSKISSVRVKHNGQRLFLSNAGKRSLVDLGFKQNDTLELEPANAMSVASVDTNSLEKIPHVPGNGSVPGKSTRSRKGKGKKRGKGKK